MYKASASQKITSVLLYKKPLVVYNFLRSALQYQQGVQTFRVLPSFLPYNSDSVMSACIPALCTRSISLTSQYANNKINFDQNATRFAMVFDFFICYNKVYYAKGGS